MNIRTLISSLMIFVLTGVGLSQTAISDSSTLVLPHTGSQALEFGYSGLFSLSNYIGNTIAIKNFSSPLRATRYILNFSSDGYLLSGPRNEVDYNPIPTDSTIDSSAYDYDSKTTSLDISLSVQWIKYQQPYGNLSLLLGVGPMVGMSHSIRENVIDRRPLTYSGNTQASKSISTSVYLGLAPVVGVEWFLHRNISFHAEYYTLMRAGWRAVNDETAREYSSGDWHESDSDLSGVYYSVRGYARAGVAFYFK
ncbi:MAG: hypothetical protein HQ506_07025 [Candidatus Marinimicrobia bacterium]|nr:hypothetical protein [Candidatus Neomarinimicrobiota bacterium]